MYRAPAPGSLTRYFRVCVNVDSLLTDHLSVVLPMRCGSVTGTGTVTGSRTA
jgi:hypothetical protein